MSRRTVLSCVGVSGALALASCFDLSTRWEDLPLVPAAPICAIGEQRCTANLERCEQKAGAPAWVTLDDCATQGLVCAPSLLACKACIPDARGCDGQTITVCHADGNEKDTLETCDPGVAEACRGGSCVDLCNQALIEKSNVGCEYWAVDLDNAMIDATSNAAAQQFAVVISNAQPDLPTDVHVFQDDGAPGDAPAPLEIASAVIAPMNLTVFKLGPREVDGSPAGQFNTGTHTALTRHAYKITSKFPVVAYQFNPLENANVFSNDASLLKPREALDYGGGTMALAYVVAGWPQTIAHTDDPNTNFNPQNPINLRAFLTVVGTREETTVRVTTAAAIVGGGPVEPTAKGGVVVVTLGAFDVLNLETGDFDADFTGSLVEADGPVAVFTGSEASDAPRFEDLAHRRCCADHLEDQLDPVRAAGRRFIVPHSPSRTTTVGEAGAEIGKVAEPDYVRFVAVESLGTTIKTTLLPPDDSFVLSKAGAFREVIAYADFSAESDRPVIVEQVMASQDAAGVKRGLPGGDPSILIVPPYEQFRASYVFLTPDKYAFDFVSIVAPPGAAVYLDDSLVVGERCPITPGDGLTEQQRGSATPPFVVYTCQLGFAVIDPLKETPDNVALGVQSDGVHRIVADTPVGVFVSGFDSYVSYAYAGGTDLRELSTPQ